MWFGTMDGLNRFDGYGFMVFKHDPEDPGSLSNDLVRAISVGQTCTNKKRRSFKCNP
jgi:hypothetical protein